MVTKEEYEAQRRVNCECCGRLFVRHDPDGSWACEECIQYWDGHTPFEREVYRAFVCAERELLDGHPGKAEAWITHGRNVLMEGRVSWEQRQAQMSSAVTG